MLVWVNKGTLKKKMLAGFHRGWRSNCTGTNRPIDGIDGKKCNFYGNLICDKTAWIKVQISWLQRSNFQKSKQLHHNFLLPPLNNLYLNFWTPPQWLLRWLGSHRVSVEPVGMRGGQYHGDPATHLYRLLAADISWPSQSVNTQDNNPGTLRCCGLLPLYNDMDGHQSYWVCRLVAPPSPSSSPVILSAGERGSGDGKWWLDLILTWQFYSLTRPYDRSIITHHPATGPQFKSGWNWGIRIRICTATGTEASECSVSNVVCVFCVLWFGSLCLLLF